MYLSLTRRGKLYNPYGDYTSIGDDVSVDLNLSMLLPVYLDLTRSVMRILCSSRVTVELLKRDDLKLVSVFSKIVDT